MKKLNSKGFTLIELLAVITIMGILMMVAIPAVSRTIENSRRDTFMDTALAYINAAKNAVAADELYVTSGTGTNVTTSPISAQETGYYCYSFDTSTGTTATDLMEQGGKSSWGNSDVKGYIVIQKTVDTDNGRTKYTYAIRMIDTAKRGITKVTPENALKRSSVLTSSNVTPVDAPAGSDNDTLGSIKLSTATGTGLTVCKALSIG